MPTVTWDAAFEADPGDPDAANQGANEIRKLKLGISERLELETNFKTGTQPLIKAGIASVCYSGNTTQIGALSSPSANALAYNSQLAELQRYSGAAWANLQINHGTLANLTAGDPHTQYLKLDKANQELSANLDVSADVTVDGVDISNLATDLANHAAGTASSQHTNGVGNALGSWDEESYDSNSNYTANTDGFVIARAYANYISIKTPSDNANAYAYNGFTSANQIHRTVICPIRKDDTWRVDSSAGAANTTVRWIPLGS